jgi:excisionase family DNA binding protein
MYTVKEASVITGFSQSHIRRLIEDGVLKSKKYGQFHLLSEKTVQKLKLRRELKYGVEKNGNDD